MLVYLKEWKPVFSSSVSFDEVKEIMRRYRCAEVFSDAYAHALIADHLRTRGVTVRRIEDTKSTLFLKVLPLIRGGLVVLLDNPTMRNQFTRLERRASPSGSAKDIENFGDCGLDAAPMLMLWRERRPLKGPTATERGP